MFFCLEYLRMFKKFARFEKIFSNAQKKNVHVFLFKFSNIFYYKLSYSNQLHLFKRDKKKRKKNIKI